MVFGRTICIFYLMFTRRIKPAQPLLAGTSLSLNGSPLESGGIQSNPPRWNNLAGWINKKAVVMKGFLLGWNFMPGRAPSASDRSGSELPGPDKA